MTASDAPSRRTTLFVTPLASVLAVHVSETEVDVGLDPSRFVGAVGAVRSIVQLAVAGVGSAIPPTDASTEKLCVPAARPEKVVGLAHATHALPSSRQVNVAVLSVEWNVKDPEVDFVKAAGPLSITVSGGGLAAAATSAVASSNTRTSGTARSGRQEIRGRDIEGRPDIDTGMVGAGAWPFNGFSWQRLGVCPCRGERCAPSSAAARCPGAGSPIAWAVRRGLEISLDDHINSLANRSNGRGPRGVSCGGSAGLLERPALHLLLRAIGRGHDALSVVRRGNGGLSGDSDPPPGREFAKIG